MQNPKAVDKYCVSFTTFIDTWRNFSMTNVSRAAAHWFIDDGPKFVMEEAVPQKLDAIKEHRYFSVKCGAFYAVFTPNDHGFDMAFVEKYQRRDILPTTDEEKLNEDSMATALTTQSSTPMPFAQPSSDQPVVVIYFDKNFVSHLLIIRSLNLLFFFSFKIGDKC